MNQRQFFKDKVYLDVAKNISRLSKDENTQIGCVIVAKDGTPVSWGYNGNVSGFRDDFIPHSRDKKELEYLENHKKKSLTLNKYPFMCHAEENAMDFGDNTKLNDATVYLTGMPCGHCARQIAKKKIGRVVVAPNKFEKESTLNKDDSFTKLVFAEAGIKLFIGEEEILLHKV